MKPIETPVYRPTAPCIWNSFLNSNKRHLILTGGRKTGKTTLLSKLLSSPLPGITTWAEPEKAVYLKENLTGETAMIGTYDASLDGKENKMVPCPEGFSSLGIPALMGCLQAESEWITIDEIGYLESAIPDFQDTIRELLNKKRLIAVVRKQPLPFLQEICNRDDVFIVDLDNPFGNIGCVIMASGLGRRFGGNKLMADFKGEPMISRIIAATEGIFARRVVVTRHDDIAALCHEQHVDVILHDMPHRSDTIRLGLEGLGNLDTCMFCPSDQPILNPETIAMLVLSARNNDAAILRPVSGDIPGSPVIFPKWTFPELLSLPEGQGGSFIIKKHPEQVRLIPIQDEREMKDVDRPEDLAALME